MRARKENFGDQFKLQDYKGNFTIKRLMETLVFLEMMSQRVQFLDS